MKKEYKSYFNFPSKIVFDWMRNKPERLTFKKNPKDPDNFKFDLPRFDPSSGEQIKTIEYELFKSDLSLKIEESNEDIQTLKNGIKDLEYLDKMLG